MKNWIDYFLFSTALLFLGIIAVTEYKKANKDQIIYQDVHITCELQQESCSCFLTSEKGKEIIACKRI